MSILRLSVALLFVQAGFHAYTATLPLALARAGTPDATVGLIMGVAAIVQIPVAIGGGRLLDRFGGARLFTAGGVAYLLATGVILLPGVDISASLIPFVLVRVLQGAGIALASPAALSLVPRLVPGKRVAASLSYVAAAQNLTLVLAPPLSLAILDATALDGVAAAVVGVLIAGILLGQRLPLRAPEPSATELAAAGRHYGITFRREWAIPLLIIVTYVAHWGAVTAYLPIRAEQAGADIGLYFAADGTRDLRDALSHRLARGPDLLARPDPDRRRDDDGRARTAAPAPLDATPGGLRAAGRRGRRNRHDAGHD